MTNESIFMITEIWLNPTKFEEYKSYRTKFLDRLEKYNPEYVYHGHPFIWIFESGDGEVPTGIEVLRFETEEVAQQAIDDIKGSGLLGEGYMIFNKTRGSV